MQKVNVIKVGGNVIEDQGKLSTFLEGFAHLSGNKILVHGGGKLATRLADQLGIKTQLIDGRRITSSEMLDIVVMSYGGLINKKIVAKLQGKGIRAIGLTGCDGDLIRSNKRPLTNGVDYGWVGDPEAINKDFLMALMEQQMVPVVAPLTHDGKGNMLNTNADTIASQLAVALSDSVEVTLNYCFELHGVMEDINDPNSLIHDLTKEKYQQLKEQQLINDGMIPKLDNAFNSIAKGVAAVHIMKYDGLKNIANGQDFTIIH